jgi:CrcB protein
MISYLLVFLGAGIGGALRHGVNLGCARYCGVAFPWGTLTVNVAGSFIMGALAAWLALRAGEGWSQPLRLLLATGSSAASPPSRPSPSMRC